HQVAYARALENLTGANLSKLFPTPRIPTAKIPECQPHIQKGEHLKLYRFSPDDYREIVAVFNGQHPETGEDLIVVDEAPEGFPPARRGHRRGGRRRQRQPEGQGQGQAHLSRTASAPRAGRGAAGTRTATAPRGGRRTAAAARRRRPAAVGAPPAAARPRRPA